METTATWDPTTSEFVINSPSVLSQKYWITNGAIHAKWSGNCAWDIWTILICHAVVFAQLIFNGKHEGIHAFLVRIREEDMSVSTGVVIQDMGHKVCLLTCRSFPKYSAGM
jgi:acyl-CoA oxidase